eukprot:GILI01009412.1.p1 GENE.GILI01009412.1~~GILI01009412.1.p1  ORF type:complete len:501 (-),score=53.55 GILI01009412.1:61-1563(-)
MQYSEAPVDMPNDLFMAPHHDGLACTTYREGILMSGGVNMRLVWRFSFRSLEWSLLKAQGQYAPSGRVYHTACMWGDSLIIVGGVTSEPEDFLHVNRLDMTSMRWSRIVANFPEPDMQYAPFSRSHHAATVVGDYLYVQGGKPVQAGLTTTDYRRLHQQGFYDILIMHLPSGAWTRLAHSHPGEYVPAPPLWGHTMAGLEDGTLVMFGGFEIDLVVGAGEASFPSRAEYDRYLLTEAPIDAPSAELQNVMNVFSLQTQRWFALAPNVMTVGPRPRALHTVQLLRNRELIVLGGISMDDGSGEIGPASDAWAWNADSGAWKQLDPFPIPPYHSTEPHRQQGAKVMSTLYNDQLVVSNDITSWYVLDTTDPVEFTVMGTDEIDYFFCACVDIDEWQVVTAEPPMPYNNPLAQPQLPELSSVVHPRRNAFPIQLAVTAASHSHSPSKPSPLPFQQRDYMPVLGEADREDAVRKFLPFAKGAKYSPERPGQINPIIAALIAERL